MAVIPAKAKNPDTSKNPDSAKASLHARVKPKMTLSPFHIRITLIRDELKYLRGNYGTPFDNPKPPENFYSLCIGKGSVLLQLQGTLVHKKNCCLKQLSP